MSESRYKARKADTGRKIFGQDAWEIIDKADDDMVVLERIPKGLVIEMVEALNHAYARGIEDRPYPTAASA